MNTRGPYEQYTVNGNDTIPRRTVYRKRQRLQFEVDEQIRKNLDEVCIFLFYISSFIRFVRV
jgi:hypothetical protein